MKYTIEPAKRKPFDFWVVFLFSSYFCEMKREKNGGYNTQRRLRGGGCRGVEACLVEEEVSVGFDRERAKR
jgi:hypothetical protein